MYALRVKNVKVNLTTGEASFISHIPYLMVGFASKHCSEAYAAVLKRLVFSDVEMLYSEFRTAGIYTDLQTSDFKVPGTEDFLNTLGSVPSGNIADLQVDLNLDIYFNVAILVLELYPD